MSVERTTCIETDVSVSLELAFDADELVHVVPSTQTVGDLDPVSMEGVGLEELVEEFLLTRANQGDYTGLYCMAHELRRLSETLSSKAYQIEDSAFEVGRRFNVDPETMIGDE